MALVDSPILNPASDKFLFRLGELWLGTVHRRHPVISMLSTYASPDLAGFGVAGDNSRVATSVSDGRLPQIQSKVFLPRAGIGSVALKTVI
jgi:hypothetical protein